MTHGHRMQCAITGSNGYVGSVIKGFLLSKGCEIVEMRRIKNGEAPNPRVIPFSLCDDTGPEMFKGLDVLIHCAYDFRLYRWRDIQRVNVLGSKRLLEAAEKAGVRRRVVISTMSAFEDCRSMYGKAKLEIEAAAAKYGAVIVRPGLVYGPQPGGMVGSLNRVVAKSTLVPIIGRGNFPFYLTHQDDLAELIWKACEGEIPPAEPISAVSENPVTFAQILRILAKGKNIILLPVPTFPVWLLLRTLEQLGIPVGFRSDSLVSLVHQNQTPSFELTRKTGVLFREFSAKTLQS